MGITSFVGLSHPNILRMKNLPFQACLFYYSLFCSNKFGKRSNKKTKAFTLVFLLLYSRWELPFGESCSNILRLKNHPFQVCLFSSSCFYSNEFEKALETKNPKQLLWVFQSSVLETGIAFRRVLIEHLENENPSLSGLPFLLLAFLLK